MKHVGRKEFERRYPNWFEFGIHTVTGGVDVNDGTNDVFEDVEPALAKQIIEVRDKFIADLATLLRIYE